MFSKAILGSPGLAYQAVKPFFKQARDRVDGILPIAAVACILRTGERFAAVCQLLQARALLRIIQ
jgi:hypothetical protein